MKIWIVAYEQVGECEICVQVFHSLQEAEALAEEVAEELSALGDGYHNTSITEYDLNPDQTS